MSDHRLNIRIGCQESEFALNHVDYLTNQLLNHGVNSEVHIIAKNKNLVENLNERGHNSNEVSSNIVEVELLNSNIDIGVYDMKTVPTYQENGLLFAAVSNRKDPSECLVMQKSCFREHLDLKLYNKSRVATTSLRRKMQILSLNPHVVTQHCNESVSSRIENVIKGVYNATIIATSDLKKLNFHSAELKIVALHPREFVPAPAQGVLVFQTQQDDLKTRKLLKLIHNSAVARLVNIERKVLKMMGGEIDAPLGIYCESDQSGNIHAFAALGNISTGEVNRISLSQSTSHLMAERIYDLLINKK